MDEAQQQWLNELPAERFPEPYQTMAREIGIPYTVRLAELFGGSGMYFPELDKLLTELRNANIRAEFDGGNHKALARKYGLSERWIYEILKAEGLDENQMDLFAGNF